MFAFRQLTGAFNHSVDIPGNIAMSIFARTSYRFHLGNIKYLVYQQQQVSPLASNHSAHFGYLVGILRLKIFIFGGKNRPMV